MKKIIMALFMVLLMASPVIAWSASRSISGQQVTINIQEISTTYSVEEYLPSGCSASSINNNRGYSNVSF